MATIVTHHENGRF